MDAQRRGQESEVQRGLIAAEVRRRSGRQRGAGWLVRRRSRQDADKVASQPLPVRRLLGVSAAGRIEADGAQVRLIDFAQHPAQRRQ